MTEMMTVMTSDSKEQVLKVRSRERTVRDPVDMQCICFVFMK